MKIDYRNLEKKLKLNFKRKDLLILKKLKVDFVFLPNKKNVYDFKRKFKIKIAKKDKVLCAKYRKCHFFSTSPCGRKDVNC